MSDLIDTTEMYLKAIFELVESGVTPMRAKLANRLSQAMPSVSQTIDRMAREGLVELDDAKVIHFTELGEQLAISVMRKHRISEVFLNKILGFDWIDCHEEACRWEHVVSELAEEKMLSVLGKVYQDPYGNPIPGLEELGLDVSDQPKDTKQSISSISQPGVYRGMLSAIGEPIQANREELEQLRSLGLLPGASVELTVREKDALLRAVDHEESLQLSFQVGDSLMIQLERGLT